MAKMIETKLRKAVNAACDALQHLAALPGFDNLQCTHIDRMLARIVDLPTEPKQKNSRRNLWMIRQWMLSDGPGVVLLEVLGQLYWRLGDLNSREFEEFKATLHQDKVYLDLLRDPRSSSFVVLRLKSVQKSKARAFEDFEKELEGTENESGPEANVKSSSDGLIKINPSTWSSQNLWENDLEHTLVDFYINGLCPGRTLIKNSNTYLNLLSIADQCRSTRFALLSLSASYMKDYMVTNNERYHQADPFYMVETIKALAQEINKTISPETCLATGMLLVHHDIVNENEDSELCWSCHFNLFDMLACQDNLYSDPEMFLRYQLILAQTAQPISGLQWKIFTSSMPVNWLTESLDPESKRIIGVLGCSRQLLFIITSITNLLAGEQDVPQEQRIAHARLLETQLARLSQWTTGTSGKALEVVVRTAETYRIAAQIYLQCRVFGLTRFQPNITNLNETLCRLISTLPVSGNLYTALFPIWPFFIAATTCNVDVRDCLFRRVLTIRERDKGNFGAVLQRISAFRMYLESQSATQKKREGWWEEMLGSARPRKTMLCLG